jgi:hypothetical protein
MLARNKKEKVLMIITLGTSIPETLTASISLRRWATQGGTITIWKSTKFQGIMVFQNDFGQSVEFCFKLNGQRWSLTNIYAPCTPERKINFLNWFGNIDNPEDHLWIILRDFNLVRRPENRNKLGGDSHIMQAFNEAISNLGLLEIPLSWQAFTWSNR